MSFKGNTWLWQYLNNTDNIEFLAILSNGLDSDLMGLWYFIFYNFWGPCWHPVDSVFSLDPAA